jgi:hypothetical protein
MTRWHAIIAFICLSQASFGQNHGCVGIEITEAVRNRNARIRVGYAFSEQWSAEAISSFHLYHHSSNGEDGFQERGTAAELAFRHWVKECWRGAYLSFGIFSGFRTETDMKFSIGYSLPILESIGVDVGYGFKFTSTIRQKTPISGELTLEIHYIF